MKGIGVTMSGGRHRASLFGPGVLLYLADAGKMPEITSIASVSGGSTTNGYVARTLDISTSALTPGDRPTGDHVSTFGDLMLRLRRQLLTQGELTALCIASFGDADWRLAPIGG